MEKELTREEFEIWCGVKDQCGLLNLCKSWFSPLHYFCNAHWENMWLQNYPWTLCNDLHWQGGENLSYNHYCTMLRRKCCVLSIHEARKRNIGERLSSEHVCNLYPVNNTVINWRPWSWRKRGELRKFILGFISFVFCSRNKGQVAYVWLENCKTTLWFYC